MQTIAPEITTSAAVVAVTIAASAVPPAFMLDATPGQLRRLALAAVLAGLLVFTVRVC